MNDEAVQIWSEAIAKNLIIYQYDDGEVLVAGPFESRYVLGILRIVFQRLGDAIPFDEWVSSMECIDCSIEMPENRVR